MNSKFTILKAIGIFLVVYGHIGGIIFLDWFNPYSFHMPLFVFISGYFYKKSNEDNLTGFTYKKIKGLLYPYFRWNLFYGILTTIFISIGIIQFGQKLSFNSFFIEPWISGHQYIFNLAAWFVLTLFLVQILYILSRKIIVIKNEFILLAVYLSIGIASTYFASKGYNTGFNLTLIRVGFSLPFFHLGYIYKIYLEKRDRFNVWSFLTLFIIQAILFKVYGNNLNFAMVSGNFNNYILAPFLSSITGIWLCVHIADILNNSFKESKVLQLIGNNTWTIMMHHVFFYWLIKTILYYFGAPNFDINQHKTNIWYVYPAPAEKLLFFVTIACLFLPIFTKMLFQRLVSIKSKKTNSTVKISN